MFINACKTNTSKLHDRTAGGSDAEGLRREDSSGPRPAPDPLQVYRNLRLGRPPRSIGRRWIAAEFFLLRQLLLVLSPSDPTGSCRTRWSSRFRRMEGILEHPTQLGQTIIPISALFPMTLARNRQPSILIDP